MTTYTVGVDIGGTFTDIVCAGSDGSFRLMKRPTTKGDPAAAVREAIAAMRADWGVDAGAITRFVHGSTVATNAVIERKGARTGIVTTAGFKDALEIGRQMRHRMYDLVLQPETPVFLAPGARRKEVRERIAADGAVVVPLDEDDVRRAAGELVADGVEAVAVVFLFSFINPAHERRAREIIAGAHPHLALSLSSEVDPAFREYERTAVTAFDAYLKPVVADYIARMAGDLADAGVPAPLQIMQSRGGISSAANAARRPVRLFLSGPAAGVVGGVAVGAAAGAQDLITVDIGGTSCDIALVSGGRPLVRAEGVIDGHAVRVPMVDVTAIGSGGGSIARLDEAGALRVGPQSAGAEPGPACYGRGGTEPTVTDASLVLGYLDPGYFAGGTLRLDLDRARAVIAPLAARMGMSVELAALGIHRVLNAQMAEAMRLVSIGRGIDPRGYALLPLGGAGPIHAAALAAELGMTRIIVPPHPGVLSAAGLLAAPIEHEVSAAFPRPLAETDWREVVAALGSLDARCARLMAGEGVASQAVEQRHFADICYVGQGYHLEIPLREDEPAPLRALYRDFLTAHDRVYGYAAEAPARFVNLRAVHRVTLPEPAYARPGPPAMTRPERYRRVLVDAAAGFETVTVHDRSALAPGTRIAGPAIVEQPDTTTLVPSGWGGRVSRGGHLVIEPAAAGSPGGGPRSAANN
ncbi:MAG TPA: hydantoinase/oxoprolinase family protein [Stellaceae bacterium]|nr:hydantoinase/oxoprolinase family protein [Stellaceae bacterium]